MGAESNEIIGRKWRVEQRSEDIEVWLTSVFLRAGRKQTTTNQFEDLTSSQLSTRAAVAVTWSVRSKLQRWIDS